MKNRKFYKDLKKTFRPKGPNGKFDWLSTSNIDEVMEQYSEKYKDFKFFGAVPIDFDDLEFLGIKNIDFDSLISEPNQKSKIGFVFNLDEHWQSGSHWVALFSDLLKKQIYFFDSYGEKPEKRIKKLVKRIANWMYNKECDSCELNVNSDSFMKGGKLEEFKKIKIKYNRNRHQYKNSECGVYSLNFILRLLNGHSFEQITENKTLDDDINKCRDVYFHFNEGKNPIKK